MTGAMNICTLRGKAFVKARLSAPNVLSTGRHKNSSREFYKGASSQENYRSNMKVASVVRNHRA